MDKKQFESMLILIVPAVVNLIKDNNNFGEIEAIEREAIRRTKEALGELSD